MSELEEVAAALDGPGVAVEAAVGADPDRTTIPCCLFPALRLLLDVEGDGEGALSRVPDRVLRPVVGGA